MNAQHRAIWLTILNYAVFIVLLIGVATHAGFITVIDHAGQQLANRVTNPTMTKIMLTITQSANPLSLIAVTALIIILLISTRQWRWGLFVGLAGGAASLLNLIIKLIIQRARPTLPHLIEQGGYSFPSGHLDSSIAIYGALILFLLVTQRSRWWRTTAVILLTAFILSIGFSRIYVHVHFPTDVLAGWFLGWGHICVLWLIARRTWLKNSLAGRQSAGRGRS